MYDSNVIAWLLPSRSNALALQTIHSAHNKDQLVTYHDAESPQPSTTSGPALCLSFDRPPKSYQGFVLGTGSDCDIVLPKLPGISRHHCYLTFDTQSRLVLRDASRNGTAVWYDAQSNGDRRNFTWTLSSGGTLGFPDLVRRIVIDIQTVRFQIVVNDPSLDMEAYRRNIDSFQSLVALRHEACLWDVTPRETRNNAARRPVYVKYTLAAENGAACQSYLWNSAKPWEPVISVLD